MNSNHWRKRRKEEKPEQLFIFLFWLRLCGKPFHKNALKKVLSQGQSLKVGVYSWWSIHSQRLCFSELFRSRLKPHFNVGLKSLLSNHRCRDTLTDHMFMGVTRVLLPLPKYAVRLNYIRFECVLFHLIWFHSISFNFNRGSEWPHETHATRWWCWRWCLCISARHTWTHDWTSSGGRSQAAAMLIDHLPDIRTVYI